MGAPEPGDIVTDDSMTIDFRTAFRADAGSSEPATTYLVHVGDDVHLALRVSGGRLTVLPQHLSSTPPDLEFATSPDIRFVVSGELAPAEAIATGTVRVLDGNPALLERFASTFSLAPQAVPF